MVGLATIVGAIGAGLQHAGRRQRARTHRNRERDRRTEGEQHHRRRDRTASAAHRVTGVPPAAVATFGMNFVAATSMDSGVGLLIA